MSSHTRPVAFIPALLGTALWAGASALLCEEAWHSGVWNVSTVVQPALVASAIASGVFVHKSIGDWRPIRAAMFLCLALLASVACLWNTVGRMADAQDHREGDAMRDNRTLALNDAELATARADAARECKSGFGVKCIGAKARIDALVSRMASMRVSAIDPRADALARVATLAGYDGARVKALAQAIDPLLLPATLELGSILFWSAAFRRRNRPAIVTQSSTQSSGDEVQSSGQTDVSHPQVSLMNQLEMARAWGVHPSTASRRLRRLEAQGQVRRQRDGRSILALPAPASLQVRRAV